MSGRLTNSWNGSIHSICKQHVCHSEFLERDVGLKCNKHRAFPAMCHVHSSGKGLAQGMLLPDHIAGFQTKKQAEPMHVVNPSPTECFPGIAVKSWGEIK